MNPVSDVVAKAAGAVTKGVFSGLDELFTSDEELANIDLERAKLALLPRLREMDERIAQANHKSLFVAGGRPAGIWIGNIGVGFMVMGVPLINWAGQMWGGAEFVPIVNFSWAEIGAMAGMANGAAWIRHRDKVNGVARNSL